MPSVQSGQPVSKRSPFGNEEWTACLPALFSLNLLVGTESGRAYSEQPLMDVLAETGVTDFRRLPVQTPNDSGMV
jgi:hypothetical protein